MQLKLKRFITLGLVAAVLAVPAVALAESGFLFGDRSGFVEARDGVGTIGVERLGWLEPAMRYWNNRSRRPVFVFSDQPKITSNFRKDCVFCAIVYAPAGNVDWQSPYARCEISILPEARDDLHTVAHELGHCLGFTHQSKGVMTNDGTVGIRRGWRTYDRGMMLWAGYALPAD